MTFVDQTKENLLGVQTEIQQLKDTVDTMAKEMKADCEAQKKSADAGKKLNKTAAAIGGQVAEALASDVVEAEVTSDAHLRPKEPPKLRTTDFGEQHTDWKHSTFNSVQFWNKDVAQLMTKKDLSFMKNEDNEDEFWLDPKLMSANEAGVRMLSTAVRKKACTHLTNAMILAQSGPAIPTVQDEDSKDDRDSDYPEFYLNLNAAERQQRQLKCLKTSVYVAWQALLQHNDTAADCIMQKLSTDSESAMTWIQGKARWPASRHIASSHFAIQDWRKSGHIIPLKVDTTCQYANMFTKNLPHSTFVTMRKMVRGRLNDLSTPYAPEWQPADQHQPDTSRTPAAA